MTGEGQKNQEKGKKNHSSPLSPQFQQFCGNFNVFLFINKLRLLLG